MTIQDSGNLWFVNNVVDSYMGPGVEAGFSVNEWANTTRGPWAHGVIAFFNNTFVRNGKNAALNMGGRSPLNTYLSINNITDGADGEATSVLRMNNLYTGLLHNQKAIAPYYWTLGPGELIDTDMSNVFAIPEGNSIGEFRLSDTIPAIGAGTNIARILAQQGLPDPSDTFTFDLATDIEGNPRTSWDLGAFEHL